ncbi:S-adenosylhomocysteine deaminase [Solidesulfovibrio carbinoliphilus subsp. oakridgensis]|uniref:5-methylthioadenosine/S-adenosylhomocysteine deaminase n=1 Tax=Solidesulfovibrio carbinoliphilus subsp. oakridgensis TaxID=694327 RepID=G7QDG6_9BACT|nr:amidohydrolase [Solidesulfovibrio carbinoliphilus]EHJ46472.1 S-adenosylhomocysteine deaminase [Solidesulfovibrio carbinoliphilus subsp. oakridgensis]
MQTKPLPCDLLVTAGILATQNEARDILRQAALAVTGGHIAAVGSAADLVRAFAPAETLDLSGCLVLPGLVNTHTHAAMTLFRGLCDDAPLAVWLTEHIWPAEAKLTSEAVRAGTELACAEMLASGTTCFLDAYLYVDAIADAVDTAGLRAVLCQGVFDIANANFKTTDAALASASRLADRLAGHDRLRPAIFPHAVYTCSAETLARCADFARDRGLLLSTHAAETARENDDCQKTNGRRVIPYLKDLGLLGPQTLLAHGVALDAADIETVAVSGACVAHCPKSNMKLASGIAPVQALRAAGVTVGLGTDGAASNNALNLFSEMNVAALLQKVATGDPTALGAGAALDMATRDGAAALGWPELGRLTVGGPADLCALDLSRPQLCPAFDPVSDAVYAASGGEVVCTMVAGKVLYRDGEFTGFDYPELRRRMCAMTRSLKRRS